jgi:type IV pilus assembly protein PilO
MNLSDINWDLNASGTWPFQVKAGVIAVMCLLAGSAGIFWDTFDQMDALEQLRKKEPDLKSTFEIKQKKAVNLKDYIDQLNQIEISLEEMIRQMPTQEEVASLLIDISQTGLASGLEFKLFKPEAPISKDFYSELPIAIEVNGKYEELGLFVSGLASLPRIVTVHDITISPISGDKAGNLSMKATIKTYNEHGSANSNTAKSDINKHRK